MSGNVRLTGDDALSVASSAADSAAPAVGSIENALFGTPPPDATPAPVIDTGPLDCCLDAVLNLVPGLGGEQNVNDLDAALFHTLLMPLVKVAEITMHDQLQELHVLLRDYAMRTPLLPFHPGRQLQILAVSRWIHYQEKHETTSHGSETSTQQAVMRILNGRVGLHPETRQRLENQLKLLQATISPTRSQDLGEHLLSANRIKEWHAILFEKLKQQNDVMPSDVGCFRTEPVYDGLDHQYPHHEIVEKAIITLCHIVNRLGRHIEFTCGPKSLRRLACVFALGAFVQFHFVDIHPFIGANGRICRFLSKYILDTVCPVPFPMYKDRDAYVHALKAGRKVANPQHYPTLLLKVLFDAAIEHYKFMSWMLNASKARVFQVDTVEELTDRLQDDATIPEDVKVRLAESFRPLMMGESTVFEAGDFTYTIKRSYIIEPSLA